MAALETIPTVTGTEKTGFSWSVYTGDLVAHDPEYQLSRDFVMYTEVRRRKLSSRQSLIIKQTVMYDLMRKYLGSGPMYAALGNHDSYDQCVNCCLPSVLLVTLLF